MGRRRKTDLGNPAGVRTTAGRWYWTPTSELERDERRRKGLKVTVGIGKAGSLEARTKWAELTGLREGNGNPGTVGDLLTRFNAGDKAPILTRRNGKPRADETVKQYRWRLPALHARFGASVYGRTEADVIRGRALGAGEIQRFITASGSLGRAYLAILDGAFDNAILDNLTTYNPCGPVIAPAINARTREPLEWELECLGTMALPHVALILDYKAISGYRISECLRIHRRDKTPKGIKVVTKGGKRELLLWSPRLHEIVAAAEQLPTATKFPASPIFPHTRGRAYTYSGWNHAWLDLKAVTNAALADGVVDPDTLERHAPLSIEDLHVHDVRSKVHDDAEDMGRQGHEQLGNTEATADRYYSRREKTRRPLR